MTNNGIKKTAYLLFSGSAPGSARLGPARPMGSAQLGPARPGAAWLGSARPGPVRLGSAMLG